MISISPLISLGPDSLCPAREKRTMREPEVYTGNSGFKSQSQAFFWNAFARG
jgi:hypothetical protein